jgi:hypothetical protein
MEDECGRSHRRFPSAPLCKCLPHRSLETHKELGAALGWVGLGWVALLLLAHASDNIDSVTDNAFQPQ